MKYLLDTHAFLWFITEHRRLSQRAGNIIKDRNNEIFFSAASAWEICIKRRLGRLAIEGDPELFIVNQLAENQFRSLPIQISHSVYTLHLPEIHKDPFDRMLISQSHVEGMTLISADQNIQKYDISVLW
jgi:PIN domain nuclease of toxin-antitoxin system